MVSSHSDRGSGGSRFGAFFFAYGVSVSVENLCIMQRCDL